jgi:hypothetical protein
MMMVLIRRVWTWRHHLVVGGLVSRSWRCFASMEKVERFGYRVEINKLKNDHLNMSRGLKVLWQRRDKRFRTAIARKPRHVEAVSRGITGMWFHRN